MSLPYFPLFPADFEADTSHLTMLEDGAYNRLLRLCWMTPGCSLPGDEAWIMRRARAHTDQEKEAVRSVLSEFFTTKSGRVLNARLSREAMLAQESHDKRVAAGRIGGRKSKPLNENGLDASNAKAKPKQPEPEPEPEKKETDANASVARARAPAEARLPEGWRPSEGGMAFALEKGLTETEATELADEFAIYWSERRERRTERGWDQTWRNRVTDRLSTIIRNRRVAVSAHPGGGQVAGTIASIAARRAAERRQ